jgi:hypothetical protein
MIHYHWIRRRRLLSHESNSGREQTIAVLRRIVESMFTGSRKHNMLPALGRSASRLKFRSSRYVGVCETVSTFDLDGSEKKGTEEEGGPRTICAR